MNTPLPRWDGVAGWDADPKRDRCHFSSPVGEDGDSIGDETVVEDDEDVIFEVSSAPEEVTSCRVFEKYPDVGRCFSAPDRP